MRIFSPLLVFIIAAALVGCTSGNQVNARSLKTANRSVNRIKDRLPAEKRIEFEVSYWTLRDSIRSREEFLDKVDGKTPEELIELGKEVFQNRKSAGFKNYQHYNSWDEMITQFSEERNNQGKQLNAKKDPRNGSVLYRL